MPCSQTAVSQLAVEPRWALCTISAVYSQLRWITVEQDGLTVILIPRQEGVTTKIIKTSYSSAAGTAYVTFDNVRVPVENTLGPEGGGIFVILSNFNHERWVMICASARSQRMVVEECLKWISQRKAFGKPLSSQAVVRAKVADMVARAEAVQSWLENVTYQMCNMVRGYLQVLFVCE